jgi:hypothetical protein
LDDIERESSQTYRRETDDGPQRLPKNEASCRPHDLENAPAGITIRAHHAKWVRGRFVSLWIDWIGGES